MVRFLLPVRSVAYRSDPAPADFGSVLRLLVLTRS